VPSQPGKLAVRLELGRFTSRGLRDGQRLVCTDQHLDGRMESSATLSASQRTGYGFRRVRECWAWGRSTSLHFSAKPVRHLGGVPAKLEELHDASAFCVTDGTLTADSYQT
jgi:hypothetical protein